MVWSRKRVLCTDVNPPVNRVLPRIMVDGPFGSASEDFLRYETVLLVCDIYVTTVWGSSFWGCEGVEQSSEMLDFVSSVGVVGGVGEKKTSKQQQNVARNKKNGHVLCAQLAQRVKDYALSRDSPTLDRPHR